MPMPLDASWKALYENAPGRTRTCDHRIRNPMLYPPELPAQTYQNKRFTLMPSLVFVATYSSVYNCGFRHNLNRAASGQWAHAKGTIASSAQVDSSDLAPDGSMVQAKSRQTLLFLVPMNRPLSIGTCWTPRACTRAAHPRIVSIQQD